MRLLKLFKFMGLLIVIFLLYEICGALLPFILPVPVSDDYKNQSDLNRFFSNGAKTNDKASIVETNKSALDMRLQMIHKATESIIYCTFDIRVGKSCDDVFSALYNAAQRGVKVQLLMDGLNGQKELGARMNYYGLGMHPNVQIRFYNLFRLLKPWTFNGRMHDKYIIVDQKMLLLGGRNTFDYFIGEYNNEKMSFDREVFIYNEDADKDETESAIRQVETYFDKVWNLKVCEQVYDSYRGKQEALLLKQQYFEENWQSIMEQKADLFADDNRFYEETIAVDKVTLLANPTHIYAKEPYVWYDLYRLMKEAKERVYIFTPYAVLNKEMYAGFEEINSRVDDFTMLVNSRSVGDNFMASSDYTINRRRILKTGVDIYEFQGTNSSHGKSLLIDDNLSVIGSYNFDLRSTYLDTELMLVIEGKEFNQELEGKIKAMEAQSLKVNPDGTYEENKDVPPVPLSFGKSILFRITSIVFQLIRYLL